MSLAEGLRLVICGLGDMSFIVVEDTSMTLNLRFLLLLTCCCCTCALQPVPKSVDGFVRLCSTDFGSIFHISIHVFHYVVFAPILSAIFQVMIIQLLWA